MAHQLQVVHDLAQFLADELDHPEEIADAVLPLLADAVLDGDIVNAVGQLYELVRHHDAHPMAIEAYVRPGYETVARTLLLAYQNAPGSVRPRASSGEGTPAEARPPVHVPSPAAPTLPRALP